MSEPTLAEAGPAGAREDACREYQSSLQDLTFNSKRHINMLTMVAEQNLPFAKEIVSLIEARIAKAPSSEKLPVLYLMDSIVKNVGREYLAAFATNLVATFICVFEKVDANTRKRLFKLRSTWNEIFPLKELYALDVRVNSLDPAWPIRPLPPNGNPSSIHVTPTLLNKSPEEPSAGKIRHSGCKQSHMQDFMPPSREERNAKRSAEQDVHDPKRRKKTEEERPHETTSQPVGGLRFEGHRGQPVGSLRFEGPHGQPVGGLRFDNPGGQPVSGHRFEGGHGPSGAARRFDGPHGQPAGEIRFEGPLLRQGVGMRFEGPHGQSVAGLRFEGQHNALGGNLRFEGPHGPPGVGIRLEGPLVQQGGGMRFERPVPGGGLRLEGPLRQGGPRWKGCHAFRSDGQPGQPSLLPRFDGLHGHPGPRFERTGQPGPQRFDGPPGQQVQPRFDGVPQRFAGPQHQQASRFDAPLGLQGTVLTGVAQPVPFGQGQQFLPVHPPNPGAFVQNPPGALPKADPDNHLSQVDVNELFSKLLKAGILKLSQPDSATTQVNEVAAQPPAEEEEGQNEDRDVPDLTNFTTEELKQRYDSVINRLYTGIQCSSCGMRFTTSQADVYADHLDWHYWQNRTEKGASRKVTHRRWYNSSADWIECEGTADLEERAKSQFFEKVHEEVVLKTQEAAKEKEFRSVPAGPAGAVESCAICQEQFEQYWDEEEEEWHLKNAIRVDGETYHPSCYEDDQNTSSFDCTPSPSKTPFENPWNIMLSAVKNESQEPRDSPKVKEEQIDAPPACTEDSTATPVH
ncbi:pre-mRNA cleavage complex 2 protein Pcf11-like [Myotis lucifugus]|uniref:pre-mRNA cleavage complex 2 protein Pcf11-like n=1 Tax=Myotis lucifugus TaxID=59463 RepID=UPI0006D72F1B|nr:pre-mRNA cleavage complex 2 protein Pcf11-like [Myotis lucifugus]